MKAHPASVMPLRRVVGERHDERGFRWEVFECGHEDRPRTTGLGYVTTAQRRRCWQCHRDRALAACPDHQPVHLRRPCPNCDHW